MIFVSDLWKVSDVCVGGALQEQPHHADDGDGLQLPGRSRLVPQLGQVLGFSFPCAPVWCDDFLNIQILILSRRLIKHVNEMEENIFLSYSSPSCYLAALHSKEEQVWPPTCPPPSPPPACP